MRVDVLDEIPKGPTGKIQRRLWPDCWAAADEGGGRGRRGDRRLRRRGAAPRRDRGAPASHAARTSRPCARTGYGAQSARRLPRCTPPATDDPAEIGPVDIVFLGLKAYSYAERARCSHRCCVRHRRVAAQNGIPWWYFHGSAWSLRGAGVSRRSTLGAWSLPSIPPRRLSAALSTARRSSRRLASSATSRGRAFLSVSPTARSARCLAFSEAMVAGGLKCPVGAGSSLRHLDQADR